MIEQQQQQTELVFESGEKGRLLRGAAERFGLSPGRNKRVFDLVNALDQLGWQDGCRPSVARIAAQMARKPRAVQLAIADAKRLGVVAVLERMRDDGSLASNEYVIQWDAIRRFAQTDNAPPGREGASVAPPGASLTPPGARLAPGWRKACAPYRDSSFSSSSRKPPPPAPSANSPERDEWREVEEVLTDCEVGAPRSAAKSCREAGLSPAAVLDVVAHWRSRRPAWGPGALWNRLANATPGMPVEAGWAPPNAAAMRREVETAAVAVAESRAEELLRFESLAGERLAAMTRAERDRFAREVLDDGTSGGGPLLGRYVRRHQREPPSAWPPELRLAVLRGLIETTNERKVLR